MTDHIIHIVCGPTASGKSSYALDLAENNNGVIINCDSLQIYDGLATLTAQPDTDERKRVLHELYAALHPNEVCSAGNWREMVMSVIEGVLKNGQTPIITGGTGLYIKALMDGLSPMPDIPDDIRDAASDLCDEIGAPALHDKLREYDPVMAGRLDPYNKARLIRAWEVLQATGKSLAEWQDLPLETPPRDWGFKVHKIMPDREMLYQRCHDRFDAMMAGGVLDEVEAFQSRIDKGEVKDGVPITKALGFKPLVAYLNGHMPKDDAVDRAKTDTRHYAKRQMTWFRNQL